MLPDQVLSDEPITSEFQYPRNLYRELLVDRTLGGVALNDASQGLAVKLWTCYLDGNDIMLQPEGGAAILMLTAPEVTELGVAFTQNMSPVIVFVSEGQASFYWFDTLTSQFTTTDLPVGTITPRCAIDDDRSTQLSTSDVIIAYVRNNALYFRAQRDRYQIEYLLDSDVRFHKLHQLGMNTKLRFQFSLISGEFP